MGQILHGCARTTEAVHLTRWLVDTATSGSPLGDVIHVMIKPIDVGPETSAAITTNRRIYHIRLIFQREGHSLIDEKFIALKVVLYYLSQQFRVRFFFSGKLMVYGNSSKPDIFIDTPLEHKTVCSEIVFG